ncbi:MAG: response regulator transcription factor [Desulfuromonadales bacterium]|nr:response regulator transcription factor [Desulfuromonadales bacterium]
MDSKIRILFVDDHEVFHECMRALFAAHEGMEIVAAANNGLSAVRLAGELRPDIVVMDMSIPVLHGIEATRQIVAENPEALVIILSGHAESDMVREAFHAGAKGYVLKEESFTELVQAIETVRGGYLFLSPRVAEIDLDELTGTFQPKPLPSLGHLSQREKQVLALLAEGKGVKEISTVLDISSKTVETHRANLMKKLDLYSLPEITRFAVSVGLVKLSL